MYIKYLSDPTTENVDPWTQSSTGCACPYDETDFSCACCDEGGCKCGELYPNQCVECGRFWDCGVGESRLIIAKKELF